MQTAMASSIRNGQRRTRWMTEQTLKLRVVLGSVSILMHWHRRAMRRCVGCQSVVHHIQRELVRVGVIVAVDRGHGISLRDDIELILYFQNDIL